MREDIEMKKYLAIDNERVKKMLDIKLDNKLIKRFIIKKVKETK